MKRNQVAALLTMGAGLLFAASVQAGSWQNNAPFGATLQGDLYTPTTPAASPAILVAIHYCSGNSGNAHSWFQSAADSNGFYIIAPNAGKNCFDSSISRSGDPAAIVKMVQYVLTNKNADASRVFAAGFSSGGCMTNTLLAIYPEVFAGGSALPGFPAGLWPAGDTSCTKCGSSPGGSDTGQSYARQGESRLFLQRHTSLLAAMGWRCRRIQLRRLASRGGYRSFKFSGTSAAAPRVPALRAGGLGPCTRTPPATCGWKRTSNQARSTT